MPALAVVNGTAYLSWYGSPDPDFTSSTARWAEMFAATADPLAAHPHFIVDQVSGPSPVHVGGIDTAGTVGSNSGANWGLRDFESTAVDSCGSPHPAWAVDNGPRPRTPPPSFSHARARHSGGTERGASAIAEQPRVTVFDTRAA
jgi:hypothetical protein